jgi:hypothetical protein
MHPIRSPKSGQPAPGRPITGARCDVGEQDAVKWAAVLARASALCPPVCRKRSKMGCANKIRSYVMQPRQALPSPTDCLMLMMRKDQTWSELSAGMTKLMAYRLQATSRRQLATRALPDEEPSSRSGAGDRRGAGHSARPFEAFDERRRTPPFLGRKAVPTVVDHGLGALTCAEFS